MREFIKKITPDFIINLYRQSRRQFLNIIYRDDNVLCPLCNSKFKEFAPYGSIKRINARCIFCGSLERHRLLWKYLNDKTDIFTGNAKKRVLHFAPEKGLFDMLTKNQNIEYIPCDLMPERYDYKSNVKITQADITNIPFDNNYFDVIICYHVLEHIPDDRKAMSELYRVMTKGGWGIIQVPIFSDLKETYEDFTITSYEARSKAFGQYDHVRCYGLDYIDRLKSVGFRVTVDKYIERFTPEEIFTFGLIPSEFIYLCER
jgi:SAM-dependent methyltransferase